MAEKDIGAVPVLDGSRLVGIFSERDILKRIVVANRDVRTTRVREVMTTELIVAAAGEDIETVMGRMQTNRCRHMPVVAGDRVIGFLSLRDLLSADLQQKGAEVEDLNRYIYYVPPTASGF
jgi:CBS domain-containing protein